MTFAVRLLAVAAALLAAAMPISAQTTNETYLSGPLNLAIPDNSILGTSNTINVSGSGILDITAVTITLNISGGFNGDYYAYLQHTTPTGDSFIAILLNRSGVTAANADGYLDGGFANVTFSDAAAADIHLYQMVVNPGGAALSGGTWQPDGRTANPAIATDGSPRLAFLSSFQHQNADGSWTLFVADAAAGGEGSLVDFSLSLTGVPEPGTWAAAALLASAFGWHQRRRWLRR